MHAGCKNAKLPFSRQDFWRKKLGRNVERDKENTTQGGGGAWTADGVWQDPSSQPSSYSLVAFAEDRQGLLYAIDHAAAIASAGRILEIRTPTQVLFRDGFE